MKFIIDERAVYNKLVLGPGKPFQTNVMFVGKARCLA
jgi:hypothetical protein